MRIMYKNYLLPIGLLSAAIIGAGIFSLPFVFKAAGLSTGFFYLALTAFVYVFIHLMYADVILRTPGEHRFVGYTKILLGEIPSWLAIWMVIIEMIFVLTIYLVLSASFGNLLFSSKTGLEIVLIFWFLGSAAVFLSLKRIALFEFLITGGIIGIIILIFILGFKSVFGLSAADFTLNVEKAILPLSPILFALAGRAAIPAITGYFKGNPDINRLVKKVIIFGTIIPAIVYALFIFGIISLTPNVTEDAVSGLVGYVPAFVLIFIGILGLISLWSSYIIIGVDIEQSLEDDLRLAPFWRFLIVIAGPLLIYFFGFKQFLPLVSFVGGIFIALEGFFIISMWLRAKKKLMKEPILFKKINPVIIGVLLLTFSVALVYEIAK